MGAHSVPLSILQPVAVAVAAPSPAVSADEAHETLILTSSELAALCQEEITDTGKARIARLIEQVGTALNQTVAARNTGGPVE